MEAKKIDSPKGRLNRAKGQRAKGEKRKGLEISPAIADNTKTNKVAVAAAPITVDATRRTAIIRTDVPRTAPQR